MIEVEFASLDSSAWAAMARGCKSAIGTGFAPGRLSFRLRLTGHQS